MFNDEGMKDRKEYCEDGKKHGHILAQAYVPFQKMKDCELYAPEESLIKGTIFPELYRPYEPVVHHKCKKCKPVTLF